MSDRKRLHRPVPGALPAERAPAPAADLPAAPVPVPMVPRNPADAAEPATVHRLFGRGAKVAPDPSTAQGGPPRLTRQDRIGPGADTSTSMAATTSSASSGGPPPLTRQKRFGTPSPRDPHLGGELDSLGSYEIPVDQRKEKDDGSAPDMYDGTPIGKLSGESTAEKRKRVAALKAAEPTDKKNPHQPTDDLGEMYAHIGMMEAEFKHQVGAISAITAGKASFRPGGKLKGLDRTFEKAGGDYKNDLSRMVDLCGGSVSYDTPEALVAAYGTVRSWEQEGKSKGVQFNVVRVKNSLVKGKGYGDINLSIEMGGSTQEQYAGYVFELQLHLAPIIDTKTAAHKQYEGMRSIEARNKKAGKGDAQDKSAWDQADQAAYQSLEDQMNAMYGVAWAQVGPWAGVKQTVEQIVPFNPT